MSITFDLDAKILKVIPKRKLKSLIKEAYLAELERRKSLLKPKKRNYKESLEAKEEEEFDKMFQTPEMISLFDKIAKIASEVC